MYPFRHYSVRSFLLIMYIDAPESTTNSLSSGFCVGCDIVQADHAPEAGVAQGNIHGDVIRHHGRNQEEVEEELEEEVKGQEEEDAQTPVRMTMTMDEMERHCEALEPK